jgi:cardiolipin synthase
VCWAYLQKTHFIEHPPKLLPAAGSMWAAFVVRDNLWHRYDIEQAYLTAMENATTEIVIACAYFLPGIRFRHALRKAARRGIRVVLLLQARVEYRLLDFASHAMYSSLLRHGIEIYEYQKSFMHSKVAVIDRRWATVGSSNIDPMSFLLAREANVVVNDIGFATELSVDLQQAMDSGAQQVTWDAWQHGHLLKRFLSWLAYGLTRLMMGVAGYSDRR